MREKASTSSFVQNTNFFFSKIMFSPYNWNVQSASQEGEVNLRSLYSKENIPRDDSDQKISHATKDHYKSGYFLWLVVSIKFLSWPPESIDPAKISSYLVSTANWVMSSRSACLCFCRPFLGTLWPIKEPYSIVS